MFNERIFWHDTVDMPSDMMTHVGEEAGMFYALGYAGHGVAMGNVSRKEGGRGNAGRDDQTASLRTIQLPRRTTGTLQWPPVIFTVRGNVAQDFGLGGIAFFTAKKRSPRSF
jgi:hypothetical protein